MTKTNRQENVESAMKSCELEGFTYTEEEKAVFQKIASGEITTEEARKAFLKL